MEKAHLDFEGKMPHEKNCFVECVNDTSHCEYEHIEQVKRKKGRPKKCLNNISIKEKSLRVPQTKCTSTSSSSSMLNKAQSSRNAEDVNVFSLSLAMGYENPHEKIVLKSFSLNEKYQEEANSNRYITPFEIIQQVINYKKSGKCSCLNELCIKDIACHRMETTLLDRQSRDFFIMGLLRSAVVTKRETKNKAKMRNRFIYRFMNVKVCHCCFLLVNNIGGKYIKNLKKHFTQHGVVSRVHGNIGRKPYHAIQSCDIADAVDFINRYATVHGTPTHRSSKNPKTKQKIRLSPSDNVTFVHKLYKEACEKTNKRDIALTSFRKIWSRYATHVELCSRDVALAQESPGPVSAVRQESSTLLGGAQTVQIQQPVPITDVVTLQGNFTICEAGNPDISQSAHHTLSYNYNIEDVSPCQGKHIYDGKPQAYNYNFSTVNSTLTLHTQSICKSDTTTCCSSSSMHETLKPTADTQQCSAKLPLTNFHSSSLTSPVVDTNHSPDKHLLLLKPSLGISSHSSQLQVQFSEKESSAYTDIYI